MRESFRDQPFAGGDEIVEDLLLVLARTRPMPLFAELSATSRTYDCVDASTFQEWNHVCGKRRRLAYAKASVSIDHRGIVTTSHHPSLMQQKHWYPGSVKRFKPHLFDLKRHRIERYFVSKIRRAFECLQIQAIHDSRHQERRE